MVHRGYHVSDGKGSTAPTVMMLRHAQIVRNSIFDLGMFKKTQKYTGVYMNFFYKFKIYKFFYLPKRELKLMLSLINDIFIGEEIPCTLPWCIQIIITGFRLCCRRHSKASHTSRRITSTMSGRSLFNTSKTLSSPPTLLSSTSTRPRISGRMWVRLESLLYLF